MFKSIIACLRQPNILKICKIFFALFLLYFAIYLFHYHYYLITFPYPNNYREGLSIASTTLLMHGINPYSFFIEPQYSNGYGIVYPAIVLPFAKLFGANLVVHRALTGFFILASCAVIFFVLKKKNTPLLLNFWAILTLYASLLFPLTSTPCVDPGATGLFFMLLTIFIPFFLNYSYPSIVLSIVCGLLAFYTKPYFLLGMLIMAPYLFLFISKKKSIVYGAGSFICFILSVMIMNHAFPSYFDETFFPNYNIAGQTSMMIVLERQLYKYADLHKGTILIMSGAFIYSLIYNSWAKNIKNSFRIFLSSIQWVALESPLIVNPLPLDIYAGICFGAILVLSLGKHYGANLWYFFQLFSPFWVIFIARICGRFALWPIVFSTLLIYNLFSLGSDNNYQFFNKNIKGWLEIETLIKTHEHILNSPLIAPLMIQDNKEVIDDGSTEFFPNGGQRKGFFGHFLKEDKKVYVAETSYLNKIQEMIKYKKFDLVIVEAGYSSYIIPDNFKNDYKCVGLIPVNTPQDRKFFLMTIWIPI